MNQDDVFRVISARRGQPGSRPWAWLILLPFALLVLIMIIFGPNFLTRLDDKPQPVTELDRAALITIETLNPWLNDHTPDKTKETITKVRHYDGSYTLSYQYGSLDEADTPYLACNITYEPKPKATKAELKRSWTEIKRLKGDPIAPITMAQHDDWFTWGEASHFALLKQEAQKTGNAFATRQGNHAVSVVFTGVYFDKGALFGEFITPSLEKLLTYDPAAKY